MTISERLNRDGQLVINRNNARRASSNAIYRQAGMAALQETNEAWLAIVDANNARSMSSNAIYRQAALAARASTVRDLLVQIDLTEPVLESVSA